MVREAWYQYQPRGSWGGMYMVPCRIVKTNPKRSMIECRHQTKGWTEPIKQTVSNHLLVPVPTPIEVLNEFMALG